MEFLKSIFGNKTMSYEEFITALNAHNGNEANKDKQIKLANLATGEYVGKLKYDDMEAKLTGKQTELDTANNLIAELKKGAKGNEELQGKITGYETQVAQLQAQLAQTQIENAIKVALLEAKATDINYLTFKLKENGEKLELGEDGKIKGIDDKISSLKTSNPNFFETAATKDGKAFEVVKLPKREDTSGITQEQFNKMGYQSRLKVHQEQPELYAKLTGKATE